MSLSDLRLLILRTFTRPREVARFLIGLHLSREARWLSLLLVMALTALFSAVLDLIVSAAVGARASSLVSILVMTAMQGLLILYGAAAMSFIGRTAGGKGSFADALVLMVWIEFILILAQCVQVLVMALVPVLTMAGMAALVALLFYLLTLFSAELHGFKSTGRVAFTVIGVFMLTAMAAATILGAFLPATVAPVAN